MFEEEKKEVIEASVEEDEIEDDGFTDLGVVKTPEPPAPEEPKPEERKEEEKPVQLQIAPADPLPEEEPDEHASDYDDPRFQRIDDSRVRWYTSYRKMARIKTIVSVVILLGVLAGGLLPLILMKERGQIPFYIALGVLVVGLGTLLVFSFFQRKHDKREIGVYFNEYYDAYNEYAFDGLPVEGVVGKVEDKISESEFRKGGIYTDIRSIGSRDNITFTYDGMDCAMADAAAQKDSGKQLVTIFVGKFLRTANNIKVDEDGLVIYFNGNDRAIPPDRLPKMNLLETAHGYGIYGSSANRKALPHKVKSLLPKIRTNKLLVDVAIVIKPGKTYWYLGYEDTLMVLPSDQRFDPQYLRQYKTQIATILEIAKAMYDVKGEE